MGSKQIKLSKSQWQKFFKLTFNVRIIEFIENTVTAKSGLLSFVAWIRDERIYVQFSLCGNILSSAYFKIDSFEYDMEYTDEQDTLQREHLYNEFRNSL
jgi:hypothetical protein